MKKQSTQRITQILPIRFHQNPSFKPMSEKQENLLEARRHSECQPMISALIEKTVFYVFFYNLKQLSFEPQTRAIFRNSNKYETRQLRNKLEDGQIKRGWHYGLVDYSLIADKICRFIWKRRNYSNKWQINIYTFAAYLFLQIGMHPNLQRRLICMGDIITWHHDCPTWAMDFLESAIAKKD